jgi:hypothetical protein
MFILSLIAALSGTPLRIVEAAEDLAHSIAELSVLGSEIEPTDGGVGDDSDATIKANPTHVPVSLMAALDLPRPLSLACSARHLLRCPADPPRRPPSSHSQRLALLQCFLI